jgi:hypothetical protein
MTGFAGNDEKMIEEIVREFLSDDWPTVLSAKEKLENLESASIPYMVKLLDEPGEKKLRNTGDLIYPGAERFFGHGQIIDYDIDKISIRAGWLLEELTFQNFGFSGIHLLEAELVDFIKFTFTEYYNNSINRKQLEKMNALEKRELIKSLSIKRTRDWWKNNSASFNRLSALVEALTSSDEKRQVKALFYLRNGKTSCHGLDKTFYKNNLENIIANLAKVDLKRVSEHAKLILFDKEYEWLSLKPHN